MMAISIVVACEKYVTFHFNLINITSVLVTHSPHTSFLAFIPENNHHQNLYLHLLAKILLWKRIMFRSLNQGRAVCSSKHQNRSDQTKCYETWNIKHDIIHVNDICFSCFLCELRFGCVSFLWLCCEQNVPFPMTRTRTFSFNCE